MCDHYSSILCDSMKTPVKNARKKKKKKKKKKNMT